MLCTQCGLPLAGGDEAALFVCPTCGLVYEVKDDILAPFPASTAGASTELAVSSSVHYLAVWRLLPAAVAEDDAVWALVRRAAAGGPAYIYVPAFSLARPVVQRLGVRLTEVQPQLALTSGAPAAPSVWPALAEARPEVPRLPSGATAQVEGADDEGVGQAGFDGVSPILVGRREAWGLAHFIYMAIQARETHDVRPADIPLEPGQEELLFLPALWDPRCIHEFNWRLLLREFDGLVA